MDRKKKNKNKKKDIEWEKESFIWLFIALIDLIPRVECTVRARLKWDYELKLMPYAVLFASVLHTPHLGTHYRYYCEYISHVHCALCVQLPNSRIRNQQKSNSKIIIEHKTIYSSIKLKLKDICDEDDPMWVLQSLRIIIYFIFIIFIYQLWSTFMWFKKEKQQRLFFHNKSFIVEILEKKEQTEFTSTIVCIVYR